MVAKLSVGCHAVPPIKNLPSLSRKVIRFLFTLYLSTPGRAGQKRCTKQCTLEGGTPFLVAFMRADWRKLEGAFQRLFSYLPVFVTIP